MRACPANCSIMSSGWGVGMLPNLAGPARAGSSTFRSSSPPFISDAHNVMRVQVLLALEPWWRRGFQHRRPGVRLLPGVRALVFGPRDQHFDNCRDIVIGASAIWPRVGSVAPLGAAGC